MDLVAQSRRDGRSGGFYRVFAGIVHGADLDGVLARLGGGEKVKLFEAVIQTGAI